MNSMTVRVADATWERICVTMKLRIKSWVGAELWAFLVTGGKKIAAAGLECSVSRTC